MPFSFTLSPRLLRGVQAAPNRVCCNALLAAFARARPVQLDKVPVLRQRPNLGHLLLQNLANLPLQFFGIAVTVKACM